MKTTKTQTNNSKLTRQTKQQHKTIKQQKTTK